MSLTRRCLINHNNIRLLTSEIQPRINEEKKQVEISSPAPEKDKLYSRLEIELKGIEPEVMKSYAWYAVRAAEHLGIHIGKW